MPLKLANNAASKLASSLTAAATTLSITPGDGAKFPTLSAGDWFPLTVVKSDGTMEVLRCTARAADTFTVVRAQEGTAAAAFTAGDRVELRLTKAAIEEIQLGIAANTAKLAGIEAGATKNESAVIQATSLQNFFAQCLAKGSGFYRADGANIPGEIRYGPGWFSKTGDTWSFIANKHDTGRPVFFSGIFEDIPNGTWKQYDPMARGNHTGTQAIATVTGLQAALDALTASNTQVGNTAQSAYNTATALDAAVGFTIIYPNGGTEAAPARVAANSRYVMANPFPGHHVICVAEVWIDGWGDVGWDGNSGTAGSRSYGTRAGYLPATDQVVVQTGSTEPTIASVLGGGVHGSAIAGEANPLCRVKVWRLKG